MADSLPDITITNTSWTNLYTAASLTVGTALLVQNKASQPILLQIKAAAPSASNVDGVAIDKFQFSQIDSGASGVWAKATMSSAVINVQAN
jgi:hypothetical protein